MTKINFDPKLFERMIDEGMVSVKKHPFVDLWIYNYTQKCQFERCWNEVTLQCRGLILDDDFNIIARPFKKFFNYEELDPSEIPNLSFEATDKLDGCFRHDTVLNLWGGGTLTIGEIVNKKLKPTLLGMDSNGNIVPCEILDYFKKWEKGQLA